MFGFAARTKAVTRRIQSLAQLNIELAKAEGKQKATALGMAGALGAVAAVLVIYGIGFALATAAAGLSEALPLWLSLLIVTVVILALAAIVGLLARRSRRSARLSTRICPICSPRSARWLYSSRPASSLLG
jgi:nitrate/nitrite transporter NarK